MRRKNNKNDYFAMLLRGVYGRVSLKVEYIDLNGMKQSKPVIMFRGNELYQVSYTHKKQEKYAHIFYLTFCAPEIYFVNENNEIIFHREMAVSNAINYLMEYGVEIPEYFCRKRDNKFLCKAIYTAIAEIILPVIFEYENTENELDKQRDSIKAKLQAHFAGFELGYLEGINAVAKDYEKVYDTEYYDLYKIKQFEDSYAVPIDRAKVEGDIIIPCPVAAISIGVKNNIDSDRFSLDNIIGNYQKYPFNDDEPFIDPFVWQADNFAANSLIYTRASYFPLSSCSIPNQYFIPRYFYYITRINEDIINKYNDGRSVFDKIDHGKLNDLLMIRAVNDFRLKHNGDISEYYGHVMTYIGDMIRRIATADYSFLIRGDSEDVEACQRFTQHFNIDYGKIIEFIEDDNCISKCYELIEDSILSFVSYLEINTPKITDELGRFQQYDVSSHYNSIGEYIEYGKLSCAVKLKSEKLSENVNGHMQLETPDKDEEGHISIYDTFRLMGQRKKANNPYEYIYNVLKKYYDALGKVNDDER